MRRSWIVFLAAFYAPALPAQAPAPVVTPGGVVNAASFTQGQPVAPGALVSIFGANLAAALAQADTIPLATTMGDVRSVTFNNISAPLLFVSPGQINAQLPWNVAAGTANVVVTRASGASAPVPVQVGAFSPGLFALAIGTQLLAVAVDADDGTLAQPEGAVSGVQSQPTRPGRALILYGNGLGPVDPPAETGQASTDRLRKTATPPAVLIGGLEAEVLFSGLAPQFVGVNQINVRVPVDVRPGAAVPVQLRVGGITSSEQVTIAVRGP